MVAAKATNFAEDKDFFLLWKIAEDRALQVPSTVIQHTISRLSFSPDSKKIAVGCKGEEKNLLIYKIDKGSILDKNPQILKGHSDDVKAIAFHPTGKTMISASINDNFVNILLWKIGPHGIIEEEP